MNTDNLNSRKATLTSQFEEVSGKVDQVNKQLEQLTNQRAQLFAQAQSIAGALQLLNELISDSTPVATEPVTPELIDFKS